MGKDKLGSVMGALPLMRLSHLPDEIGFWFLLKVFAGNPVEGVHSI